MRISVKSRYALAAMIYMGENAGSGELISVLSISETLGISKIYLEQVFSLLKRGGLVNSVKGAQGGYQLSRSPQEITAYDILSAIEFSMFERTEETVSQTAPAIEAAVQETVFDKLDAAIANVLSGITLLDLLNEAQSRQSGGGYMFYI